MHKKSREALDLQVIHFFRQTAIPLARIALFIVFFWFGAIKLLGLSPAGPLAEALTARTVGDELFTPLFIAIALLECIIGVLFLIPKAVRIVIPLLFFHLIIVCSPLVLLPDMTWLKPLVPTLEGQYIIKNVVIVAVAFYVAANTTPLQFKEREK